jgi:hypothetical protein
MLGSTKIMVRKVIYLADAISGIRFTGETVNYNITASDHV